MTTLNETRLDNPAAGQEFARPTPNPVGGVAPRPGWVAASYPSTDPRAKSPALATLLSLMPGLGQVYIGYYEQGFINILIVASVITLLSGGVLPRELVPMFGIFLPFFWTYNLVDAWRRATFYNQALAGTDDFDLPDTMKMGRGHGSLAGGVLLIGLGVLAFSHTMFNYSLEWLSDWWPMGLIGFGAYLIGRAVLERKKTA